MPPTSDFIADDFIEDYFFTEEETGVEGRVRIIGIRRETRIFGVPAERRVFAVAPETRIFAVPQEVP